MANDLGRVVFFDLETTGTDPQTDRIVEMAFLDCNGGVLLDARVNPGRPIPEDATKVHGISDADVADLAPFASHAERVQDLIDGATLVTYNGLRFDSLLLDRELQLTGCSGLRRDDMRRINHPEVDLYALWLRLEPRSLEGAIRRFLKEDETKLHAAGTDAGYLVPLLERMTDYYDVEADADLVELSRAEGAVDREGKFRRLENGRVVFNFGKHRGEWVGAQSGYLYWMLGEGRGFSPDVKAWVEYFVHEIRRHQPAGSTP